MLKINDNAPDFTLKNTNKEDVSLSDFSDKTVVLAFYPGAYTGVCDSCLLYTSPSPRDRG